LGFRVRTLIQRYQNTQNPPSIPFLSCFIAHQNNYKNISINFGLVCNYVKISVNHNSFLIKMFATTRLKFFDFHVFHSSSTNFSCQHFLGKFSFKYLIHHMLFFFKVILFMGSMFSAPTILL